MRIHVSNLLRHSAGPIFLLCVGFFFAPPSQAGAAISLISGGAISDNTTNGGNITLTFPAGVQEGDVVILYGGHPHRTPAALGPSTAGYTEIAAYTAAAPNFGVWYKVMGSTPDTSVIGQGTGNAQDVTAYAAYILRGVSSVVLDQTSTTAGPTSNSQPNAPSITTQTAGAWVVALGGSQITDTTRGTLANYSNANGNTGNDTNDISVEGATRSIASPATEDPPIWPTTWTAGSVYAVTVALKPNAAPTLSISQPDGVSDSVSAGTAYDITYTLADTDNVVTAAFYYDTDNTGLNGTAISGACATAAEGSGVTCSWDTTGVTPGTYYVYGTTDDGTNSAVSAYSSGTITITTPPPSLTLASAVNQPPYVATSTADIVLGVASLAMTSSSASVTAVTLKENGGTISADSELANIELWLSYDASWSADDNQLDTAKTFNGTDGEATFTETFTATSGPQYLIIRGDVASGATVNDTIEMQVKTVSTSVTVNTAPLEISGSTAVWKKRLQLIFDNSSQAENLSSFPVLVKLDSSRISYVDVGKSDGTDLRFVDSDGITELDYEIDTWNSSATSYVWVKVPQIDASSATDSIWMYYGNASAASGEDVANVWTNGYEAVYHFSQSSGTYFDSTSNNHDSDAQAVTSSGETTGSIGIAPNFNGTSNSNYITLPDSSGWDMTNLTIEAYIKPTGAGAAVSTGNGGFSGTGYPQIYPLITKGLGEAETEAADVQFFMGLSASPNYKVGSDYENWLSNTPSPSLNNPVQGATTLSTSGTWYYVAAKNNPAATTHAVYLNGAVDNSTTTMHLVPNKNGTQKVGIGVAVNTAGTKSGGFNGYIDEVRISNVARSTAWMAAGQLVLTDTFITFPASQAVAISSTANQTFVVGESSVPVSAIAVSDAATPSIIAANNIRIVIPSAFNMSWNTGDTSAVITGGASSKVSTTVSYPDSKTLLIDVTSDFAASDTITISGLSFSSFTAASSADNLELVIAGAGGAVAATDSKTKTIVAPSISSRADQSFDADISATTSEPITITASSATTSITAANNIRIKIPDSLGLTWDTTDTSITIGPTLDAYTESTYVADMPTVTADLSGITYNPLTDTVFTITNGTPTIYEYSLTGTLLRTITMTGFIDTEGIEWMYGTTYAVTQERDPYDIVIVTIGDSTTSLNKTNGTVITPEITFSSNLGMEGITYDPAENVFYVAVEKPAAGGAVGAGGGRVFKVMMDGSVTEYTTLAANLLAEGNTDLADIVYDEMTGHLFLLSEENNMITEASTDGTIYGSRAVDAKFAQPEGLELSKDGEKMFIVSEPDDYAYYTRTPAISTTVSFEDSGKTMVVDVTSDFSPSQSITIDGMKFDNFGPGSGTDNLELEVFNNGETQDTDDKTIAIVGGAVYSVSITTSGVIEYGYVALSTATSTVSHGFTQIAENDGNGSERINVKSSDAGGGTAWTLSSSVGTNQYKHEFSTTTGSSWFVMPDASTYVTAHPLLAPTGTMNLDFRLTVPSATSDYAQKSVTITVQAVAP
jgi:uncharacterized protein YjiK